jgi:hypothetical protein
MARADIPYDYEDFGMTADQLQVKYDREHPTYTNTDYNIVFADATDDIHPSYWAWVVFKIALDEDAIPGNNEQGNPPSEDKELQEQVSELVDLKNIDLFAAHLVAWHTRTVAQMEHFLNIPSGTEFVVQINDEPEKTIILTDDVLAAFRGGLATALSAFAELPFKAIPKEDDSTGKQDGG